MNVGALIVDAMLYFTDAAARAFTCYTAWTFLWDDHLDALSGDPSQLAVHVAEAGRVMHEPYATHAICSKSACRRTV